MSRHNRHVRLAFHRTENIEDDPFRMFIRKNRKKILISLAIGVIMSIALVIALVVFLFNVVISNGIEATNQFVESDKTQTMFVGVKDWVTELMINFDLMQLLSLFLQAN